MASEAKTGRAMRFGSRVCPSESLRKGLPSSMRLAAVVNLDTGASIDPRRPDYAPGSDTRHAADQV
ncbi:hypothetical protein GCM10027088_07510 [Nocardia goodfellowii]